MVLLSLRISRSFTSFNFPDLRTCLLSTSGIVLEKYENWDDLWFPGQMNITNGNPCITREVINRVKWDNSFELGEDGRFNINVYKQFPNKGLAIAFLYKYRKTLSSFSKKNSK